MKLRHASVFVLAAVLWMAAGPILAQDSPEGPDMDASAPAASETATTATTSVDEILAGEEEVLAGSSYSYDPGNRRDPFRSLLAAKDRVQRKGPLPEGIPGLMIEEIDLTGIFHTNRGFVAQVLASNKEKSYLIREGDELYDGDVVSITQNEVVFKQIVNDPTVIKPFREVVKKLTP
ncbi:MAG: hypothetical protein AB7G12_00210 [Thermoanaerobaculia bacterium]